MLTRMQENEQNEGVPKLMCGFFISRVVIDATVDIFFASSLPYYVLVDVSGVILRTFFLPITIPLPLEHPVWDTRSLNRVPQSKHGSL